MENMNNAQSTATMNTLPEITAQTTLGELLSILGLEPGQKREEKTPKRKTLLETSGDAIADLYGIKVFRNGFALYENGLGKYSVLWLPYCTRFIYCFNKLRDSEMEYLSETKELPSDDFVTWAWTVAVALFGEERITQKMNRGFGNADISADGEDNEDEYNPEPEDEDLEGNFVWDDEPLGVDPLNAVIRRENREEMLATMTDKQREAFILHYKYGWTQQQIADYLELDQTTVRDRLRYALKKTKKYFS